MPHRVVVVLRRDGSSGPEVACGARINYASSLTAGLAMVLAPGAGIFVLSGYGARDARPVVRAIRRAFCDVRIAALLSGEVAPAQERALIGCGADAVAQYPLPLDAWSQLYDLLLACPRPSRGRQRAPRGRL